MPTLILIRDCRLDAGDDEAHVLVEDDVRRHLRGYVAAILLANPDHPLGPWRREYAGRNRTERWGRRSFGHYGPLAGGIFEARSIRRHGEPFVTYFAIEPGHIEVIGRAGDEDIVRARLAGLDPDALAELRATSNDETSDLPELQGTARQVAWAEPLRRDRLARASADPALVAELGKVADATWWIACRNQTLDALRTRLSALEWDHRRAALQDAPPGDPGPPW